MKKHNILILLLTLLYFQGRGQQFEKVANFNKYATYNYEFDTQKNISDKKYETVKIEIERWKKEEETILKKLNSSPNIKNLIIDQKGFIPKKCNLNEIKLHKLKNISFLELDILSFKEIENLFEEITQMPKIKYLKFYTWTEEPIFIPKKLLQKLKGICIGKNYSIPNTPNNLENLAIRRQSSHEIEQTLSQINKIKIKYLEIKTDTLTKKSVQELAKFPQLKRLLIDVEKIAPFVNKLKDLKNLQSLNITRHSLSNKDFHNLKKLKNLESLSITLDSLQSEDCSSLWELPQLKKIKIYTYDNKKLLWKKAQYRNLETLHIKGKLHKIDDDLSNFKKLQEIHIRYNNLKNLPENFSNLQELKILDISTNQITQLPNEIGKLCKLEKLFAGRNKIKEIPKSIKYCKNLEIIDLRRNYIEKLPVELFELAKPRELKLSGNKLTKLPKEIGNLKALKRLWLGSIFKEENNNNIDFLPTTIQQLTQLKYLDLSKNKNLGNSILPMLLKMPNKWESLYLSACGITNLPKLGWKNNSIQSLDLSCNDISKIPTEIFFSKIKHINLNNNPLGYLNTGINGNTELKVYAFLNGVISKEELLKEPNIAKVVFRIINKCYIGDRKNPILKLYPILQVTDSTLARKASEKDIYAISLFKAKRYKESIPYFNKSIEIDLSDNITWFNSTLRLFYYRHIAFLHTGDTVSAIKDLKYITTKLNKDFSARIFEYAYLTNDTKNSKEYLSKALAYYKNKKKIKPIEKLGYLELLLITNNNDFDSYNKQLTFSKAKETNCYFIHKYLQLLRAYNSENFAKNANNLIQEMQQANYKSKGWECNLTSKWAENKKDKQIIQKLNSFICP